MGELDRFLAPFLLGTTVNVFLYGILVNQCLLYFTWYKRDFAVIKSLVLFLLLIGTTMCAFNVAMTYDYLVTNFGNFNGIMSLNAALIPFPLLTGISAFVVECFYGWRIHVFTGFRPLSACIYVLATVQLLGAIGTTIGGVIIREFIHLDRVTAITLVWLIGSSLTDIIITVALVWYLRRSKPGLPSITDDLLSKITQVTVQTGMLTLSASVAVIIGFLTAKGTPIGVALGIPVSLLYSTSLLSTLNARRGWVPLSRVREQQRQANLSAGGLSTVIHFRTICAPGGGSPSALTHKQSTNNFGASNASNLPPVSLGGSVGSVGDSHLRSLYDCDQLEVQRADGMSDSGCNAGLVDERALRNTAQVEKQIELPGYGVDVSDSGLEAKGTSLNTPTKLKIII